MKSVTINDIHLSTKTIEHIHFLQDDNNGILKYNSKNLTKLVCKMVELHQNEGLLQSSFLEMLEAVTDALQFYELLNKPID